MSTKLAIVLVLCALFSVISGSPAPRIPEKVIAYLKEPRILQKGTQVARTVVNGLKPGLTATEDLIKEGNAEKKLLLVNNVAKMNALKNPVKVEQGLKEMAGPRTTRPALDQIPHMGRS
ncbi:uncharacterized protein MELLADRAFT_106150 [Melampsora larici-populina 98AG31]|uniref:Secreted protein n=1 Tax=Melampsora larici-populina (strain 98AG31 / pathotype 3-4-7) TaxID=747676 RepID=F4RKJ9_MELLP|nr:uncharacterized protein MELLADRAFT_106150 [Melampsora larici-populina 98AG31]EGG07166.1 hypothetical protein MELLADRAFT_106150 [Melampsora larici-populina 98AG31]